MSFLGIANANLADPQAAYGSGGGGGGAFSTKSLAFDGVDDYVEFTPVNLGGYGAGEEVTVSFWIKRAATGNTEGILSATGANNGAFIYFIGTTSMNFTAYTNSVFNSAATQTALARTDWMNVLFTLDSSNVCTLYIDGVLTEVGTGGPNSDCVIDRIGIKHHSGYPTLLRDPFTGNLDEISGFKSKLGASDIAKISAAPIDLDTALSVTPDVWYRMGENSTFSSPQILMPENTNKDKFSNYSMAFDGTDDYVDCGISTASTDFSFSCWVKHSGTFAADWKHIAFCSLTTSNIQYGGFCCYHSTGTDLVLGVWNNKGTTQLGTGWNHIMGVWDDTTKTCELYLNGALELTYSPAGWADISRTLEIGDLITGNYASSFDAWNGNIDEFVYWTSKLTLSDAISIYNSGTPTDLTSLTPSAWWRMGEDATFSTNWTIPDKIGSNTGTSANMTIEDRTGDAPNSSNNSLSYNMDAADIVEETP